MRSGPSRKLVVSSASVDGAAIAAPTPCSARAPRSQACVCASPPRNDATVNSATPATNVRRRPRMSPMRAPRTASPTAPVQLSKRPKRADALRNYEKLVAAAREAFTEADRSASLEDIARRAGVGIGTLYRNFPTRADLVQAVYVDEVEALSRSAGELAERDPWEALTAWLHRFVGYVATKQALADELFAVADAERQAVFAGCRSMLHAA